MLLNYFHTQAIFDSRLIVSPATGPLLFVQKWWVTSSFKCAA